MKKRIISMKVSENLKDFIENLRATRRSKQIGTDKNMLTQSETLDLLVKFFKLNTPLYLDLIKLEFNKNV